MKETEWIKQILNIEERREEEITDYVIKLEKSTEEFVDIISDLKLTYKKKELALAMFLYGCIFGADIVAKQMLNSTNDE